MTIHRNALLSALAAALLAGPALAGPMQLDQLAHNLSFEIHPAYTHGCCSPHQNWLYSIPGWSGTTADIWQHYESADQGMPLLPHGGDDALNMTRFGDQWQVLPTHLLDNTGYSFTIWVGRRKEWWLTTPNGYRIVIRDSAGAKQEIAVLEGDTGSIPRGSWLKQVLAFNSGSGFAGVIPEISLQTGASIGHVEFDYAEVPEASTCALAGLGLVALGLYRRRRTPSPAM